MIEFALENANGDLFYLNDSSISQPARGSLTFRRDFVNFDVDLVEKTATHGAVALDEPRGKSRSIDLTLARTGPDYSDEQNAIMRAILTAKFLVDVTENKKVPVSPKGVRINYDEGSLKKSSSDTVSLTMLEPFFSDIDPTEIGPFSGQKFDIGPITNTGCFDVPPIITLNASAVIGVPAPIPLFDVYVGDVGIRIEDPLLGTGEDYNQIVIDCLTGQVLLGTPGLDRRQFMFPGTGFFNLPATTDPINVTVDAYVTPGFASGVLEYYPRTFV